MKILPFVSFLVLVSSCSISKKINRFAQQEFLNDPTIENAHAGIAVFETESSKFIYEHQGDKYFVPASNTKIITCYAALKYLPEYIPALEYAKSPDSLYIFPTGDPTLLHSDFSRQPVIAFLKDAQLPISFNNPGWRDEKWGSGWSWNDYADYYMPERNALPLYGNIVTIKNRVSNPEIIPSFFSPKVTSAPGIQFSSYPASIKRDISRNDFLIEKGDSLEHFTETPFVTSDSLSASLLSNVLGKPVSLGSHLLTDFSKIDTVYSQPLDSMLNKMMHRSDNFFAEQSLLMVSNKLLGLMNDRLAIDTLLKTILADLPQRPSWVDGSGLSRYNLFSPEDFVTILNKMRSEVGMERIKSIMATGGTGTISNYYKNEQGNIYAKTGTLTGVVALSGFLVTKKKRLLTFSVLVNNHNGSATQVRKATERFLLKLRNNL